jgi:hypothetical protein
MMPFKQQRLLAICLTICNLIPQIVLLLISPRAIGEENFSLSHPGATSKEKSFLHIRPSSIYVCLRFAKKKSIYVCHEPLQTGNNSSEEGTGQAGSVKSLRQHTMQQCGYWS